MHDFALYLEINWPETLEESLHLKVHLHLLMAFWNTRRLESHYLALHFSVAATIFINSSYLFYCKFIYREVIVSPNTKVFIQFKGMPFEFWILNCRSNLFRNSLVGFVYVHSVYSYCCEPLCSYRYSTPQLFACRSGSSSPSFLSDTIFLQWYQKKLTSV